MKSSLSQTLLALFLFLLLLVNVSLTNSMTEEYRTEQYRARGYTWPPSYVTPNTTGWNYLSSRRFEQAEYTSSTKEKYDLWLQSITSSIVQPNFTETGWGLTRAPDDLFQEIRREIHQAYQDGDYRTEHNVEVITGDAPLFIDRPRLTRRVLHELHPYHEAWAKIDLVPYTAYGFRLYRNDSSLYMHVDKPDTHIISCIFHIDRSEDAQDWPIVIEDYYGNTNEVILTPGDMLFYESSKCFHGRPTKFVGSWYTSIFVHYHPVASVKDGNNNNMKKKVGGGGVKSSWNMQERTQEGHYAIPLHWSEIKRDEEKRQHAAAHVVGTGLIEPECEGNWCLLSESIKWKGPAIDGMVLTTDGHLYPLFDNEDDEEEEEL